MFVVGVQRTVQLLDEIRDTPPVMLSHEISRIINGLFRDCAFMSLLDAAYGLRCLFDVLRTYIPGRQHLLGYCNRLLSAYDSSYMDERYLIPIFNLAGKLNMTLEA